MAEEIKSKFRSAEEKEKAEKEDEAKQAKEEKAQKLLIKAAIRRQKENELFEINQSISICFGDVIPKKKSEIFVIKGVTPLLVWMQQPYIYNIIKSFKPDEIFHPIEMYALKWTPPRTRYVMLTPLDDPQLQENMLIQLHNMLPRDRKRIVFCFGPQNPTMNLFAPKVHPSSLISYRTNDQVLEKLCSIYLDGRLALAELQNIIAAKCDVWRLTLFNLLPPDEQVYHKYLTEANDVKTSKDIERLYMDDIISLSEFADLKFPDRKKRREIESLSYPRPYDLGTCIVCALPNVATIACQNCTNLVCVECIHRLFLDEATKEGSFLLLHRKYCLRLGKLTEPAHLIVGEPSYLRELRATGRSQAYATAVAINEARIRSEEFDSEEEDDEDNEEMQRKQAAEEELKRLKREEEERLLLERPPALVELASNLEAVVRKLSKYEKEILEHQERLDETTHTEMFILRLTRLKQEVVAKLDNQLRNKIRKIIDGVNEMHGAGVLKDTTLELATSSLQKIDKLIAMKSRGDYTTSSEIININ